MWHKHWGMVEDVLVAAGQAGAGSSRSSTGADGPPPTRIVLMSDGKQTTPTDDR